MVRNGRLETLERRSSRPNFTACPSGENRSKHEVSRIPRIQAANYKCSANKVNVFIEGTRSTSFLFSLLLPLSTSRLAVTVPRVLLLLRCSPLVSKGPRRSSPSLHFRFRYPRNTIVYRLILLAFLHRCFDRRNDPVSLLAITKKINETKNFYCSTNNGKGIRFAVSIIRLEIREGKNRKFFLFSSYSDAFFRYRTCRNCAKH